MLCGLGPMPRFSSCDQVFGFYSGCFHGRSNLAELAVGIVGGSYDGNCERYFTPHQLIVQAQDVRLGRSPIGFHLFGLPGSVVCWHLCLVPNAFAPMVAWTRISDLRTSIA